jgi:hypothetical protein
LHSQEILLTKHICFQAFNGKLPLYRQPQVALSSSRQTAQIGQNIYTAGFIIPGTYSFLETGFRPAL